MVLPTRELCAQAQRLSPEVAAAAETIGAVDVARHVGVIAHDSMLGRDTPSRGLEQTAQYIAAQFQALGLQPAGDSGGWTQRYAPAGRAIVDRKLSYLWFAGKAKRGTKWIVDEVGDRVGDVWDLGFPAAVVFATDTVFDYRSPGVQGSGQGSWAAANLYGPAPVVVAGPHTLASVRRANLRDKVVIYVPSSGIDSALQRQVIELLHASNHLIIVADEDSAAFAARRHAAETHPPIVLDWYLPEAEPRHHWAVYAWAPAIQSGLAAAGFDLAEARAATTPIVREVAAATMLRTVAGKPATGPTASNVVGMLQGRDGSKVVVITAHMDHLGVRSGRPDSIANGADDNASGVAGLLELAKAFAALARAGVWPRYSIAFAAVSGGAKAFWGSSVLVDQWRAGQIVLNVNLDRLGRAARDSVYVNGGQEVELLARPAWLAAQHPELRLTVVDNGSVIAPESDHFAFVRRMIPSLYVHGRKHSAVADEDVADRPETIDAEQEARILRLIFYLLMEEPANTRGSWQAPPRQPHWTNEGRRRHAELFGENIPPPP